MRRIDNILKEHFEVRPKFDSESSSSSDNDNDDEEEDDDNEEDDDDEDDEEQGSQDEESYRGNGVRYLLLSQRNLNWDHKNDIPHTNIIKK